MPERCDQQACEFLELILQPDSCLHCLLLALRDKDFIGRLWFPQKFQALASRTKRFQSLINFGLLHFQ